MSFLRKLRTFFQKKPTNQTPPNVLPPDAPRPDLSRDDEPVLYQRVTDLPISRGRKMTPKMIVVHYTAGWQNQRPRDAIAFMQRNGHGYLYMPEDGSVWQNIMLDEAYAHAGVSTAPDFCHGVAGQRNISNISIGIEVAAGGRINNENKTWFGKVVHPSNIREADPKIHGSSGRYEKFTQAQEDSLFALCLDLCKRFKIHPSCVVGHHEVSVGRKDDPAGALSMGMHRFRALLADELAKQ